MTDTSTVSNWLQFFKDAGIPSSLGANYSVIFCDHRIQKDILGDLSREILSEMGIKAMGDIMSILKQARIVSEQVTREKTSKLLETKSSKSKKAVAQPSTPKAPPNVFARLGQDTPTAETSGVFKRLGDPVVSTSTDEIVYAGVLKKGEGETPEVKSTTVTAKAKTLTKKIITKPVPTKRKSVLERLGPAKKDKPSVDVVSSSKTAAPKKVVQRVRKKSEDESEKTEVRSVSKGPKVIRINPTSVPKQLRGVAKKKVVVKKPTTRSVAKKSSNVLDRLGKVSSTTPPPTKRKTPVFKRTLVMDSPTKVNSTLKKILQSDTSRFTKPVSVKARLRLPAQRATPSKPISSNHVSSTTSAGIFKGEASNNSSVFSRLGAK